MSRRKELRDYVEAGHLRDALEYAAPGLSTEAVDLVVDICSRYCDDSRAIRRARK